MADKALWAKRVGDWRRSGLTTAQFCAGQDFTPGGLRYWSHRLRKEGAPATPVVRMARVWRVPPVERPAPRQPLVVATPPAEETAVVVELGAVRVSVRSGFDRSTLAAVIEVVAARGGAS